MSAKHGQAVTHPAWCSPEQCTAPAQYPTVDSYRDKRGEHRSVPVESGFLDATAYLTQAVAPWQTRVHLVIEHKDPDHLAADSFPLEADSPLLLMIRQHVADQQKRYPSLVPPLDAEAAGGS